MRQSREAKAETHRTIVEQASRLFRERGIEGTSVADVMQAANKTHGGFYRHFETKDLLLESALDSAFAQMQAVLAEGLAGKAPDKALAGFAAYYLSSEAVGDRGGGCPVAALCGDVGRGTNAIRGKFGAGVQRVVETIGKVIAGSPEARRQRAAQALAMAVGAVMIARASDPDTAALFLDAARAGIGGDPAEV